MDIRLRMNLFSRIRDARGPSFSKSDRLLAFRIGAAGFAIGAGRIAGRTVATGRFAARTAITRTAIWTRSFAGLVASGWALAVTRTVGVARLLAVTHTRRTIGAGTFAIPTPRRTFGAALWRWRAQFFHRYFAVAVLIELLERCGCVGHFIGGNLAISVRVDHRDDRRHEASPALIGSAFGPRAALLRAAFGRGWIPPALGAGAFWAGAWRAIGLSCSAFAGWSGRGRIRGLRTGKARRKRECECDEDCLGFHGVVFFVFGSLLTGSRRRPHRDRCNRGAMGEEKMRDAGAPGSVPHAQALTIRRATQRFKRALSRGMNLGLHG